MPACAVSPGTRATRDGDGGEPAHARATYGRRLPHSHCDAHTRARRAGGTWRRGYPPSSRLASCPFAPLSRCAGLLACAVEKALAARAGRLSGRHPAPVTWGHAPCATAARALARARGEAPAQGDLSSRGWRTTASSGGHARPLPLASVGRATSGGSRAVPAGGASRAAGAHAHGCQPRAIARPRRRGRRAPPLLGRERERERERVAPARWRRRIDCSQWRAQVGATGSGQLFQRRRVAQAAARSTRVASVRARALAGAARPRRGYDVARSSTAGDQPVPARRGPAAAAAAEHAACAPHAGPSPRVEGVTWSARPRTNHRRTTSGKSRD